MCTSLIKMFLYTNSTSEISLQVKHVASSLSPAPARFSYQFSRSQSNEVLNKMNIFLTPVIVRYMEKNLDITKPYYS